MNRRPGRRRGQPETRAQILAAARGLFADRGFAGTSIRGVAADAGVDPALVHHYFGTKEGLFRAALEIPIDPQELLRRIASGGAEEAPRRLVETFFAVWDDPDTGPAMVSFLRRGLADHESAATVRDFVGASVLRVAAEVLVEGEERAEAEARVQLVLSQMLGVMLLRKVLHVEPIAGMPADRLVDVLVPTVTRYLRGDVPAAGGVTGLGLGPDTGLDTGLDTDVDTGGRATATAGPTPPLSPPPPPRPGGK